MATWANSLGLVLDIAGAVMLWRYGLPEAVSREGFNYLVLERQDEAEKRKAERYDKWARIALSLIVTGFALQLIAVWL